MVGLKLKLDSGNLRKSINEFLGEIGDAVLQKSQENIVNHEIIDEGTLLKTGEVKKEDLKVSVIYPLPYADSIEFGRLPGSMPPVSSIQGWVKRKLNIKDDKESRSVAWAIASDIKKKGTNPRPFLGPAIDDVSKELKRKR